MKARGRWMALGAWLLSMLLFVPSAGADDAPHAQAADASAMRDYLRRERASTAAEIRRLSEQLENWERTQTEMARRTHPNNPSAVAKRLESMRPVKERLAARLTRLESGEECHPPPLPTGTRGLRRGQLGSLGNAKCKFQRRLDGRSAVFARYDRRPQAEELEVVECYILRNIDADLFARTADSLADSRFVTYSKFDTEKWVFRVVGKQRLDPVEPAEKPRMVWVFEHVRIAELKQAFNADDAK